jgi:hypothetical protein
LSQHIKSSGAKDGTKKLKCFNCNKYAGHVAKDCPEEKKEKKKKNKEDDKEKETQMFVGMVDVIDKEPDDNAPVTFDHDETYEFIGVTIEETNKIYENYEFVPANNATMAFDQDETYEFIGVTIEVTDNQQNKIEDDDKTLKIMNFVV